MELYRDGSTVHVVGQLDARSTFLLRDAVHEQLDAEAGTVVLDLIEVEAVDLTALRAIAGLSREARRREQVLLLRGARPAVRRLLHLSHLRGLITLERPATEETAPGSHPRAV